MSMKKLILILGVAVGVGVVWAQTGGDEQPELGTVSWGRDFEGALAEGKRDGKPVFALFQEVPG